VDNVLM